MNEQMKNVVMGVAAVAAMLVGVAQGAEVPVRYQDLNLNTDVGVKALHQRIQAAANRVCGEVDGRDLAVARAHKACVERAVADAVAQVR
jgi:UrcA family protein